MAVLKLNNVWVNIEHPYKSIPMQKSSNLISPCFPHDFMAISIGAELHLQELDGAAILRGRDIQLIGDMAVTMSFFLCVDVYIYVYICVYHIIYIYILSMFSVLVLICAYIYIHTYICILSILCVSAILAVLVTLSILSTLSIS